MSQTGSLGYDDTPIIPGATWHVHDSTRPQPTIVKPGTDSTAPSDALVLFDGRDGSGWSSKDGEGDNPWKIEDGYMEVVPGTGNIESKTTFGSCQIHIEWATPAIVKGVGQGRGNSGVFLMGLYEIQVLDGYENPTYADGTTASIYGQFPPLVNVCLPPGVWQTYDVIWQAPRFDKKNLVSPAVLTLFHNGVLAHSHRTLLGPTKHGENATYVPHAPRLPLVLQDHDDLVRFRNIWCRELPETK